MTRPRLLDLFCGAGGAAMGYHRAGFDVTGVDISPQPRYPFEFHQADAMTFPLDGFDAVHASPPCQDHIRGGSHPRHGTGWMLAATRGRLRGQPAPWIIENVPGSPMRADYLLCGCMFRLGLPGMQLRRQRWFEVSWPQFELISPCFHQGPSVTVSGHGTNAWTRRAIGRDLLVADCRALLGIDWMSRDELSQAIPPAYTEHVGRALLEHLAASEAA